MKRGLLLTMILGSLLIWQAPAMAGEVDILVDKLVEHGVLSKKDAADILRETKVEAEKERQETIAATKEALMSGEDARIMIAEAIPEFIRNTKIKGDFRLRYQYSDRDNGKKNRNRGRYRFRLGMVTKVNDKVDVGFGIATGGSDPRSTNQTMQNTFDSPDIRLDYAYASYKPLDWLTIVGGKFKNPLWVPNSWLWDSDIRPEGISLSMKRKFGDVEVFMNNGFWILDEIGDSSKDPAMFVAQPGVKIGLGKKSWFKTAFTYYKYKHVKGAALDNSGGSNTTDAAGNLVYDYDAWVVSGELGTKDTGIDFIPYAALMGDYVNNPDPSSRDTGYMYGVKFGHKKVKKWGQWQLKVYYQRLEQDAWLDTFNDSDAYDGETNHKAFVTKAKVGLMKNVYLSTAWYQAERLKGSSDDEDVVQIDLNFKF